MLISLKWINQYIPDAQLEQNQSLRERLTVSFAEVEDIYTVGAGLKGIHTGKIISIKSHPNSEKLHLVTVDIDRKDKLTIVCGASNIFEGAIVPVVLPGGVVYNPKQALRSQETLTIKDAEIAGVRSQGMLCSQKELGIGEDHAGIWLLPDDTVIGNDITELFQDTIIEIENKSLTNRPDCFCHVGIAREIATVFKKPFAPGAEATNPGSVGKSPLEIKLDNTDLCRRYSAVVIKGITVKPSPLWLQLRLLALGERPINNVVDATNYVMFDMGQPLHAFDLQKLKSAKIIVRNAKENEQIVTLDGQERHLSKDHLVIADAEKTIALAGIMGGQNTEVDNKTKEIIIESANFEMYNLRRATRQLGMRTEASIRFEKGLDPNVTIPGLVQAATLITEIADGEVASEIIDQYPQQVVEKELEFDTVDATRLLGIEISKNEIVDILKSLQIEVISPETTATKLTLKIPTFRRDLNIKEDIIEEIARIYGYDKFKPTLPERTVRAAKRNATMQFERKIKQTLAALTCDELYTYTFTGETQHRNTQLNIEECIKIKNPLSKELSHLRTNLVPGILEKVAPNLANFDNIAIFEIGKVFYKQKRADGLPEQPIKLLILISRKAPNGELFLQLKGLVDELVKQLDIRATLSYKKHTKITYLDSNFQAILTLSGQQLGEIGIVVEDVKNNWDIEKNTVLCVLDFDTLFKTASAKKEFIPLPIYPSVTRELSFWISREVTIETLLAKLAGVNIPNLKSVEISDIYPHNKDKKKQSITVKFIFQSTTKTLEENDIKESIKTIITSAKELGGTLRKK